MTVGMISREYLGIAGVLALLTRPIQPRYGFGESGMMGTPLRGFGESGMIGTPLLGFGESGMIGTPLFGFGESGITGIPLFGFGESGITGIPLEYDIAIFVTAIAMIVITSELVRFAVRDMVFSPE